MVRGVLLTLAVLSVTSAGLAYSNTKNPAVKSLPKPASPQEILTQVNMERAKVGVSPLKLDWRLNKSAQAKADDMATKGYYAHDSPIDGKHGYDWVNETGLNCRSGAPAENLMDGNGNAMDAHGIVSDSHGSWMTSEPHRKALLDPGVDLMGFGLNGDLAVQHFCDLEQ